MISSTLEAMQALHTDATALDVEDILALCFAFSRDSRRLTIYLDVLRRKPGPKAQGAACLICFDLARRGDERFEAEFLALVPVVVGWMQPGSKGLVEMLLGNNAYLHELWADLQVRVARMDPRTIQEPPPEDIDAVEFSLLDEGDLADIGLDDADILVVDDSAMRAQWQSAMDRFCATPDDHNPVSAPTDGFYAEDRDDLARLERFRNDALSLRTDVSDAAHMLTIIDLFLATHTRARNLFGRRNKARDGHVRDGLKEFASLVEPPSQAIAWLMQPTSVEYAWEKVAELLLDFLAFAARAPKMPIEKLVDAYVASDRPQPPPPILAVSAAERRRR